MKDDGETEAINDLLRRNGFEDVEAAKRYIWLENVILTPAHKKSEVAATLVKAKEIIALQERQKNFIDLIKLVETADKIEQTSLENAP
jgi:hypothetical protein